ncbi:hypothetical protein ACWCPS_36185 [Streptomyces mauvecolor]
MSTFFETDHTYVSTHRGTQYQFRCEYLTRHPVSGHHVAWGWVGHNGAWRHHSFGQSQWDLKRWTDDTPTAAAAEPTPARWDWLVIHPQDNPDDDTIVCCLADGGQPIALRLDNHRREVLGDMLLNPPDPDEVAAENDEPDPHEQAGHRTASKDWRFTADPAHPERYLRSLTGTLHLPAELIGGGLAEAITRCGLELDLDRDWVPKQVSATDRVCKRCPAIAP